MRTLKNRADRLVSEEAELEKKKDHITKALKVNGYPDWMLADTRVSDQCNLGQEEGQDGEKEVEQTVLATTKAHEGPWVPVTTKKYPVVLPVCQRDLGAVEESVQNRQHTGIL